MGRRGFLFLGTRAFHLLQEIVNAGRMPAFPGKSVAHASASEKQACVLQSRKRQRRLIGESDNGSVAHASASDSRGSRLTGPEASSDGGSPQQAETLCPRVQTAKQDRDTQPSTRNHTLFSISPGLSALMLSSDRNGKPITATSAAEPEVRARWASAGVSARFSQR